MVEAISYKDNTNRNTAIATGVGAVGGGIAGYMSKNILKNGEFTDEFVKQANNNLFDVFYKDDPGKDLMKDLCNLGDEPNIKQSKKFLKKWEKDIESFPGEIQELLKKSDKEIIAETKSFRESLMLATSENGTTFRESMDTIFTTAKKIYTNHKNSFKLHKDVVVNIDAIISKGLKIFSNAEKSIKGKAGLIWGAAIGTTGGVATYILSKVFNHKES